ncbi:MAG: helix-turn-helix domain-containing protein [Patescibacteria group bacterium]|nr:helix-turn-helix domain-containing protein [Patescibacteria group bacterium]
MSTQLSLSEAAKRLKVSEKSIRRYIKAGRMNAKLIKGQKGYEYRIDASQLKILEKPPRGKNSHRGHKKATRLRRQEKQKIKKSPVETRGRVSKKVVKKVKAVSPLESVGEILKKKINSPQKDIDNLIDYKTLYENLLIKYEQTLIMLGALESQVSNRTNLSENRKIEKLEESISKQEETIMDLYQTLQLYKNEQNY